MKRILISIGIAFLLLIVYLAITSVIVVLGKYDRNLLIAVQTPVRLPQILLYYFYPPVAEDYQIGMTQRKAILAAIVFVFNVFLYSIPVYFLLGFISRFRKPRTFPANEPPPPPSF